MPREDVSRPGPLLPRSPGKVCLSSMKTTGGRGDAGLQPGLQNVGDPFPEIK